MPGSEKFYICRDRERERDDSKKADFRPFSLVGCLVLTTFFLLVFFPSTLLVDIGRNTNLDRLAKFSFRILWNPFFPRAFYLQKHNREKIT